MLIDSRYKVEKAASKDDTRPVLTHLYVHVAEDGTATLQATDSYKLARVPVTLEDGDTAGFLTASTLAEARKGKPRMSSEVSIEANGHVAYSTKDGARVQSDRPEPGKFPDAEQLYPDTTYGFTVGVNPKLLLELAEALGSPESVRLTFCNNTGTGKPDPLRPITVHPAGLDGDGIIMPIRVAG